MLLHAEHKLKLTLPLASVAALRVGPRLVRPSAADTPWLHLRIEDEGGATLELIAPNAAVLYTCARGLAALLPEGRAPRLGETAHLPSYHPISLR